MDIKLPGIPSASGQTRVEIPAGPSAIQKAMSIEQARERQQRIPAAAVPKAPGGALEILDYFPDILGERAAIAVMRYAAGSTVMHRLEGKRRGKDTFEEGLAVASRVTHSGLRIAAQRGESFDIDAIPTPGVDGLRRSLAVAICQGAVEGAFKVAFRAKGTRCWTTDRPDGSFRLTVETEETDG